MGQPDWATVKAADAAYSAMIASWVAAGATAFAALFAAVALRWAKKAAEAAQAQITILEDQLALSEPQPVIVISIQQDQLQVQNVGDDLPFDIHIGPISYPVTEAGKPVTTMTFSRLSLLEKGGPTAPRYSIEPNMSATRDSSGQQFSPAHKFFEGLTTQNVNLFKIVRAAATGASSSTRIVMSTVQVTYKNSRGKLFTRSFEIATQDGRLECSPTVSLLHDDAKTIPPTK